MADSKNSKNSASKKIQGKAKRRAKREAKRAGRAVLLQILPVILIGVSLLLLACFVTNLICNPQNVLKGGGEGEHIMGLLGFYICEIFFGLFGSIAFLIPFILIFFSLFWKRLSENGKAVSKSVLTAVTALLASAFIHVLVTLISGEELSYEFGRLYNDGAMLIGGGVIGGYLGYFFYLILNVGSVFVLGIAVAVLACYLFNLQLHIYIGKLGDAIRDKWVSRGASKPSKKARDRKKTYDYDEDDEEEEVPEVKPVKLKSGSKNAEEKTSPDTEEKKKDSGIVFSEDTEDIADEADDVDESEDSIDDEIYRGDKSVTVMGKKSSPRRDGYRDMSDGNFVENEDESDEPDDADHICADVFEGDEFEDDIKINGKTPVIDKQTGEIIFDDDDDPVHSETDDTAQSNTDEASEEGIVFDDELKDELGVVEEEPIVEYKFPPIDLLKKGGLKSGTSEAEIEENKQILREVLESFKIKVKEITCSCGPTITRYEIKPDAGVRVRAIANLVDDISLALAKSGVRIEAPIPGKAAVGVEVPNDSRATVFLRALIEAPEFQNHKSKIASCLGADVSGRPVVFDIEKMPHLLVAGTTGSGKSVCINTIIASILYRAKPDEVKLVLIDPKKVEFNVYKDIPHLSCRIVSDPKKAAGALNSAVNEMEKRFELIEEVGVRNITGYNEITKNDPDKPFMPRMVVIIDELADLMMTAPDEVETAICRIAQKARAAGIHLILGTQRPSVDVITGLIKANIPSRIAFTVTSSVDSRTIIDIGGAEKLIGMGDMLYAPVGSPKPQRVQGAFVSDGEVESIVDFIRSNNAPVRYDGEFEKSIDEEAAKCGNPAAGKRGDDDSKVASGDEDPKLREAVELAIEAGKISTSLLQRKLEVGYGRAAKIIDRMEELGYVGPADGNKPRKILVTRQDLAEKDINDNNDPGIFD